MNLEIFFLSIILSLSLCKIGSTNNEDALTPEDISAFRAIHQNDDHVLFFHDSNDTASTGFFESIFGIFGATNGDEEYQRLLAEKFPTLEIDTSIDALTKSKEDYKITEMPYVIAYHKNMEVWRELASKDTPTIIEKVIQDQDSSSITVYPKAHSSISNVPKKDVIKQIQQTQQPKVQHPLRQQVKQPIREPVRQQRQVVRTNTKSKTAGNIDNSYVDPFDNNVHYKLNDTDYDWMDYGHLGFNDGFYRSTVGNGYLGAPVYDSGSNYVYNDPQFRTIGEEFYTTEYMNVEPRVYSHSSRTPVKDNLEYLRSPSMEIVPSNRNIVRTTSNVIDDNGARNQAAAYRTVESTVYGSQKPA